MTPSPNPTRQVGDVEGLVERLREPVEPNDLRSGRVARLLGEAADTITALVEENERLRGALEEIVALEDTIALDPQPEATAMAEIARQALGKGG